MNQEVLQNLLNRSVAHVRQQGVPALVNGTCQYLTRHGLKCAAGIFIKDFPNYDEEYTVDFSSLVSSNDHSMFDSDAVENYEFVTQVLQTAHDLAGFEFEKASDGMMDADHSKTFLNRYDEILRKNVDNWNAAHTLQLVVP